MSTFIVVISMINQAFSTLQVDVSALASEAAFKCTKNLGYSRAVIRGYFEAYGNNPGGAIDPNFLKNYQNAKQAGYTDIDVYMLPCTGRSTCKTAQQQVNDLVNLINTNKIIVRTAWLDVEVDNNSGNWKLGAAKNQQILKEFLAAWNQSQWEAITGDKNWVLDSSLPLWYAIYDKDPKLNNYRPFGGWAQGTCKQYNGDQKFCEASFDKSICK
ncbi:39394_t:CDS:2 [Gigaspora margarita]|uniref:39394_t:CDS:1 n=1 Tax=Gigaspora margarita TaxID=4874 RepID=A0ABN7UIA9_GIGMA|nr:39394_t:CDS:2 [Gigaspora margarita]